MGISGKTALVTGSTSGIGHGIATRLAASGANIVLNGFGDAATIEQIRAELARQHNVGVAYSNADISKPAQIAEMIALADKEFGGVDILVNNAGIQHVAPIEEFPIEKWDAIIAINLSGAFHTTRLAVPGMKKKKGAASSISRRPMRWSPRRSNLPTSPPSTASPASPRPLRWSLPNTGSRSTPSARAMC